MYAILCSLSGYQLDSYDVLVSTQIQQSWYEEEIWVTIKTHYHNVVSFSLSLSIEKVEKQEEGKKQQERRGDKKGEGEREVVLWHTLLYSSVNLEQSPSVLKQVRCIPPPGSILIRLSASLYYCQYKLKHNKQVRPGAYISTIHIGTNIRHHYWYIVQLCVCVHVYTHNISQWAHNTNDCMHHVFVDTSKVDTRTFCMA